MQYKLLLRSGNAEITKIVADILCSKRKYETLTEGLIPESTLFNKLVAVERRTDEMLQRNRREIDDAAKAAVTRVCSQIMLVLFMFV